MSYVAVVPFGNLKSTSSALSGQLVGASDGPVVVMTPLKNDHAPVCWIVNVALFGGIAGTRKYVADALKSVITSDNTNGGTVMVVVAEPVIVIGCDHVNRLF